MRSNFNNETEEAVSPVIGVILMVAITVILAAVVGLFVFGMTDDVPETKMVQVTSKMNGTGVDFTIMGGSGASSLSNISSNLKNSTGKVELLFVNDNCDVGSIATLPNAIGQHIVLTGHFDDGSEPQVVLDKQF